MTQILLITALIIAIVLDVIRIYQYVAMRKIVDKDAKELSMYRFKKKIKNIEQIWKNDLDDDSSFADYVIEHWEDEDGD